MSATDQGPLVFVTGAGRGIGRATAVELASQGWTVLATDLDHPVEGLDYPLASSEDLAVTVDMCGQHRAVAMSADVREKDQLAEALRIGAERFGPLRAAVAVAGAMAGGRPAWEAPPEELEVMVDINLKGVWNLAQVAIPAILASEQPELGRVVAVASVGAGVGLPLLAAYCASKAGVTALVRCLAAELGPFGVTANALCPGSTRGAMLDRTAEVYGLEDSTEFAQHHMLPRLLEPQEPASLIAWLLSAGASGVTGAVIPVDAGMSAR